MNLRGRILLGSILLTAVPLILVVQILRANVETRFTAEDTARVVEQTRVSLGDIRARSADLAGKLAALAGAIDDDNDFRLAAQTGREDLLPYLRDYAGRHMSLMDLDMLLIAGPGGEVLSSGHHRSAFGESVQRGRANRLGPDKRDVPCAQIEPRLLVFTNPVHAEIVREIGASAGRPADSANGFKPP